MNIGRIRWGASGRLAIGALAVVGALLTGMLALAFGFVELGHQRVARSPAELEAAKPAGPGRHVALAGNHAVAVARQSAPDATQQPLARADATPVGSAQPGPIEAGPPATAAPDPESPPPEPDPEGSPPPEPVPTQPPTVPPPPPPPLPPPPPPPLPEPEPQPEPTPEAPAPPIQPSGEILFLGTFEDGFAGWQVQALPDRAETSASEVFEGAQAARFEVRDGDVEPATGSQRSELSGPSFDEGQDLYIRDAIRIPSGNTFSTPWQIIQQLHEVDWNGSPGIAVFLNSEPALQIGAGDGSPVFWRSGLLEFDRWHDLIYRVYLSRDPGAGFVEVWLDGVQQTTANGARRIYGQTIQTPQTYIKVGIYRSRSSTGRSLVEHDAIVIGTGLAAVSGS